MTDAHLPALPQDPGEFLLYQAEDGLTRVDVRMFRETVWLSLNQIAELFQRDKSVICRHIANLFEEGELRREGVVAGFATTAADGKTYQVEHYNLDVIISVGYRVKSHRGTTLHHGATAPFHNHRPEGPVYVSPGRCPRCSTHVRSDSRKLDSWSDGSMDGPSVAKRVKDGLRWWLRG